MEGEKVFDLIIIGAGPAGLAASIYASRYGVSHLIVGSLLGGQISETHEIDNYPGIENATGFDFSQKWGKHAQKYGVEILAKRVEKISKNNHPRPLAGEGLGVRDKKENFIITLESGEELFAKAILLATGTKKRELNISGEKNFLGKGVSYCATCDGFFYKNKTVGVIGGSDSAATAALYLADITEKVYLIYRKDKLRCEPFWAEKIKNSQNIEVVYEANVIEILGQQKVEKIKLDKEYKNSQELKLGGLFIEAGSDPDISYAEGLKIEKDEGGYIKIKANGETNVPGVFAAGDITDGSDKFRQVITAASEGAIAARAIYNFLQK